MFKTKRKRAVVLALIAFFCVGATTYVAVDWKRFGGGFLAFLRGKGDPVVATTAIPSDTGSSHVGSGDTSQPQTAAPQQVAIASTRKHTSGASHGTGGGKSDENLFKFGDPAAGGGIPPGSFIVAQNENNGGGNRGEGPAPAAGPATPAVTGPAPAPGGGDAGGGGGGGSFGTPSGSNPGAGDTGLPVSSGTPTSPSPPVSPPPPVSPVSPAPPVSPTPSPAAPAPSPTQSGTTDPGDPGTPSPPSDGGTPVDPTTPSAVPEASNLAMMSLGALFLAVAASRRRKSA